MLARGRVLSWCAAVLLLLARGAAFQLPSFQRQPPASNTVQQPSQGSYTKTNPVLKAAVGLLTNGLNGVVGAEEDEAVLASGAAKRARSISPTALKSKIQRDYEAAYFLTGDISADAYDEDCVFTGKEGAEGPRRFGWASHRLGLLINQTNQPNECHTRSV